MAQQRHRRRNRHRNLGNRNRIPKHVCCSGAESEEECEGHSEESEEDHECLHHSRQVPHGHSEGSESEVEASESSEEEVEDETEVISGQCHQHRLLIAQQRAILRRHYQEGHTVDTSEEEEEEEESEYIDSEDEELLKEARLVHTRHPCHHTSEESSDFDEEALQAGKMTYQMAEHLLRKHHHQQQKQMLEAAHRQAHKKNETTKTPKSPEKKVLSKLKTVEESSDDKEKEKKSDEVEKAEKAEKAEKEDEKEEKMDDQVCCLLRLNKMFSETLKIARQIYSMVYSNYNFRKIKLFTFNALNDRSSWRLHHKKSILEHMLIYSAKLLKLCLFLPPG